MIKPSLLPAAGWLILCTILLVLPGSAFPKEDWLSKIWFDKWVHIGLFSTMVVLWCWGGQKKFKKKYILVTTAALVYGIAMEFIQQYFVVNRSFDTGDIVADAIGCLIGYGFSWKYIKK
ncbi:MAG TPA: VanZ family protein [Chitinophagaceae bacterium]|nr:VanZ family protein [Chitinophagaceae bacterium]HRF16614.1 VanZ family protein [Chitinophagaceae bacterium]